MSKRKTRKDIDRELALYGEYTPDFSEGDKIISNKLVNLNKVKNPNILEVVRVVTPFGGGMPSYLLWSEKDGKRRSELAGDIDLRFRKMAGLEAAVFMD